MGSVCLSFLSSLLVLALNHGLRHSLFFFGFKLVKQLLHRILCGLLQLSS